VAAPALGPDLDLILFDGDCSFCNRWVRFVLERDPAARFRFAALSSPVATAVLERLAAGREVPDSVVLVRGERLWFRSAAALRIAARLRFPWPLLAVFWIVPPWLRDAAYRLVAARRHRLGASGDSCPGLPAAYQERFLDRQ
jgi:predicted DCC family thiol-disulfide oxidoreductase YuxK